MGMRVIKSNRKWMPLISPWALQLGLPLGETLRPPHFSGKIAGAIDTLGGYLGIELKGPPGHPRLILRACGERQLEAPLAEIAPRADGVGIDVNAHIVRPSEPIVPGPL